MVPGSGAPCQWSEARCSSSSSLKDLLDDDHDADNLSTKSSRASSPPPVVRHVRSASSALRSWCSPQEDPFGLPPGEEKRIVLCFTSLRVLRRTFEDCSTVRAILHGFRVAVNERDVFMDAKFLMELKGILGGRRQSIALSQNDVSRSHHSAHRDLASCPYKSHSLVSILTAFSLFSPINTPNLSFDSATYITTYMGASAAPPSHSSKLFHLLHSDTIDGASSSSASPAHFYAPSTAASPWHSSSAAAASSTFAKSPWMQHLASDLPATATGLVSSLVRQDGHVYSLAAAGDLLYTGSDSKNIRVWKGRQEFSCFRSSSGLVKAIVVAGDRVFTGHKDGKIRVWRTSSKDPSVHKRVGTLPTLADFLRSSINPSNYIEVRRHHSTVWLRHFDAVSCLSLDEDAGLLYSGSWDKTVKVWRVADSKCLESFNAHDDAVNTVAAGFDGLVFTGSADGTVKAWRREVASGSRRRATRHVAVQTLLRQEGAVTAVAVTAVARAVYCGSSDGLVSYWRRENSETPLVRGGVLRGHGMAVLCLAAAGRIVASGSADRTVRVWQREERSRTHSAVAVLSGHAGPIKCLAVEKEAAAADADGARYVVYSGSLDKSINIWRVAEWERVPEPSPRTPHRRLARAGAGDGLRLSPLHASGGGCGGHGAGETVI
ncbi:vegetative incompatibility protein HET-E-1-like [Canna indica]|uniref:Vegetative incompatibility protein HET-E-1-like n=1 Tax=Canna indica TaxID=4628 RepID=A0AAQ3JXR8_9LILI|nr:vegetative incompatibility protein HET-E-1-like [Canna indica]